MIDRNLPYYKWFWQDWRANRKVQRMSYIERGLYRELLDECWVEGFIPNDISELADICGCPDEVMADAWQVLESCFDVQDDGTLINSKLHNLRTAKDVERMVKSANGKKGGLAKSLKSNDFVASAKQVPSNCHIEEKRKEEKRREENISLDGFEMFWNSYGKKKGKPNAIKEWLKIKPDEMLLQQIINKAKEQAIAIPDPKFRKDPERWLKGQHWLDEYLPKESATPTHFDNRIGGARAIFGDERIFNARADDVKKIA